MKKNITINLCGRLFAIDEDAYELLSTYEQSLRNYFRQREGGEEIAADIEARIAELFDELKQNGTEAITIEHVREIIHRIGRPDEMEERPTPDPSRVGGETSGKSEDDNAPASPLPHGRGRGRVLYRNPLDKKMMGVLSGFAAYFGGDVLWWRLGYAGLVLLSFVGSSYNFLWFLPGQHLYFNIHFWGFALIAAYILLAILMPVAETPEDRLRMKGKEVNPQNLAEEVAPCNPPAGDEAPYNPPVGDDKAGSKHTPPAGGPQGAGTAGHRGPSGCIGCIGGFFTAIWTVITTLLRWCIYIAGVFLAGWCLFGIVFLLALSLNPTQWLQKSGGVLASPELAEIIPSLTVPFYIFVVAALLVLAITAYAIIHSLLNEFRQMPSMPYRQRIALLVMWILGLVAAGAALGFGLPKFIDADEAYNKRHGEELDARYREEHTHNGIYIQPHEWEWLQENGWEILSAKGCHDRFTAHGEYLTGDRDVRYLDCYDDHHRQRYRAERTDSLQPGTYRLTCIARANGTGACIYAIVGDQKPQFVEIPNTGNIGGDIWEEAERPTPNPSRQGGETSGLQEDDTAQPHPSLPGGAGGGSSEVILQANDGKGFGWNRLTIEPIRLTQPTVIRYGLSSDPAFTGKTWLGQWFSATDFEVTRME
ncbi:MAG: PspC domain-containing protein [Bacteroidaceae bacterium]|nr:PspC domain-containing protein [Bacteroidaceae bacterium]